MAWSDKIIAGKLSLTVDHQITKTIQEIISELNAKQFPQTTVFSFTITSHKIDLMYYLNSLFEATQALSLPLSFEIKNEDVDLGGSDLHTLQQYITRTKQPLSISFHQPYEAPIPFKKQNPSRLHQCRQTIELLDEINLDTHPYPIHLEIYDTKTKTWDDEFANKIQKLKDKCHKLNHRIAEHKAQQHMLELLETMDIENAFLLALEEEKNGHFEVLHLLAEQCCQINNSSLAYEVYSAITPESPYYREAAQKLLFIIDSFPKDDKEETLYQYLDLAIRCNNLPKFNAITRELLGCPLTLPEGVSVDAKTAPLIISIIKQIKEKFVATNTNTRKHPRSSDESSEEEHFYRTTKSPFRQNMHFKEAPAVSYLSAYDKNTSPSKKHHCPANEEEDFLARPAKSPFKRNV